MDIKQIVAKINECVDLVNTCIDHHDQFTLKQQSQDDEISMLRKEIVTMQERL
jgi:hypothetical protein